MHLHSPQVLYLGSQDARRVIRETEFFFEPDKLKDSAAAKARGKDKKKGKQVKPYKFNVLITSYDMIRLDCTFFCFSLALYSSFTHAFSVLEAFISAVR
jgi:hypothetical protein